MGLSAAYGFLQTDRGYVGLSSFERKMITKVDSFTASGTFTPPAGVFYAVAYIRAGGGGSGAGSQGAGGNSSVAFAGGTITATGGSASGNSSTQSPRSTAGAANSGKGALTATFRNPEDGYSFIVMGVDGQYVVSGGAVTPGTGIAVTVGAGGTAGTSGAAGGSGYVWIEYQVAL